MDTPEGDINHSFTCTALAPFWDRKEPCHRRILDWLQHIAVEIPSHEQVIVPLRRKFGDASMILQKGLVKLFVAILFVPLEHLVSSWEQKGETRPGRRKIPLAVQQHIRRGLQPVAVSDKKKWRFVAFNDVHKSLKQRDVLGRRLLDWTRHLLLLHHFVEHAPGHA